MSATEVLIAVMLMPFLLAGIITYFDLKNGGHFQVTPPPPNRRIKKETE